MKRTKKSNSFTFQKKRVVLALSWITLGMVAPLSYAQNAVPSSGATQQVEEVVVSGSRISRGGFTAPTPTTTLSSEDLQLRAATTVTNILYELPSVRPSVPQGTSQNTGFTPINLRNLGNNRTLILVDGRRFVPTTISGNVDANVIPSALVDRIDVVTGGASAAWGSDAVSGVVNILFKKSINGLQGNVQYGMSQHGDNNQVTASLAWGTEFADGRGEFMVAGEYSKLSNVQTFGDRDWSSQRTGFTNGVVNGVSVANIQSDNLSVANLAPGGVIINLAATSPLRGIQFGPGSTVQPYAYGSGTGALMKGGNDFWYMNKYSTSVPLERENIYSRATFDFTKNVQGFAELAYLHSGSDVPHSLPTYSPNLARGGITISRNNAYVQTLPGLASVRTILAANPGIANFSVGRYDDDLGDTGYFSKNTTTRAVVGFNGNFGGGLEWKAYYTSGQTKYNGEVRNFMNVINWAAALDAVTIGGQIVCNPNTVIYAQAAPGCTPINPFGPNTITAQQKAYVMGTQSNYAIYDQDAGGVQLQGEPFSTWAGKVSLTGGYEYRKESVKGDSDPLSKLVWNNSGVSTLGAWQYGNPQPINGSYTASEWFGETLVPLLAKLPAAQSLDLNAAVRFTDYSTSGNVTSSKVGLTYKPISSVLFRATTSRDIRAPNLNELYQTSAVTPGTVTDYGRAGNPSTSIAVQSAGNLNLKPERSRTKTFGIAFQGEGAFSGLSASADVYKIDLRDAIGSLGAQQGVSACYGAQGFTLTPSACSAITRDPVTGAISTVVATNQNFQGFLLRGVDYEVSYRFPLSRISSLPGDMTVRLLATNLRSFVQNLGNSVTDRAGDLGSVNPKLRSTLNVTYRNGPLVVSSSARYVSSGKYNVTYTTADIVNNEIPSYTVVDSTIQYALVRSENLNVQIYTRVANLFDRDPPVLAPTNQNNAPTFQTLYDVAGRSFTVGVRFNY